MDTEQSLAKLPPPFIFGEGIRGKNKKNATCLDYKARYCCKSTAMFRPTKVSFLESRVSMMMPIGILVGKLISAEEIRLTIFPLHGSSMATVITMKVGWEKEGEGTITGTYTGLQTFSVSGKVKSKLLSDGTTTWAIKLYRYHHIEFAVVKLTYDKGNHSPPSLLISVETFPLQTGTSST